MRSHDNAYTFYSSQFAHSAEEHQTLLPVEGPTLPLSIFSTPLSGLQAIVRYLRDTRHLSFSEIATLLNNEEGMHNGVQLLHPDMLADVMQQDPEDRGVAIETWGMYNNAFWAFSFGAESGYACEFWVPNMQGISGNVVLLMPNGTTYYYFSDNREFTWNAAVAESNELIPFCP